MKRKHILITVFCVCALFLCAGVFMLKTGRFPLRRTAEAPTVRVMIPEGYSLVQVAEKLEENGVCPAEEFIAAANSKELYEKYPMLSKIKGRKHRAFVAEGYIFPNTYDFYIGESADTALSRFLKNTEKKLTDEIKERAKELGFSVDEILTIASVIQKEAGIKAQMGKVSSVIYNRLDDSYNRLGCDVTVNYLRKYVSPYIDGDTERYEEYYNTYKCFGLPAGPICNPGLDAINAALYPEDTPYKFFCTDKELNFYYAVTYDEHLENCKKAGIG